MTEKQLLNVKNISASILEKKVLDKFSLSINAGELHVIMGPNGSGKSSFSNILAGHEDYKVLNGEISFLNDDLLKMNISQRSLHGLFVAFQHPVEIKGVPLINFLKESLSAHLKHRNLPKVDVFDFLSSCKEHMDSLNIDHSFLKRDVNFGFSGGEKKRFEILQMLILEPQLVVLDEIDSGLDVDSIKIIAKIIEEYRKTSMRSVILITHYTKLFEYLKPDQVHVIKNGAIVNSGGSDLIQLIDKKGYECV